MSVSAIYEGTLRHRRLRPVEHRFAYPVWMLLLDLDELPGALDAHPLFSARRPAPVRFRAEDHLAGDAELPLAERARKLVRERTERHPAGPVRLLTSPRFLGFGYNPVSFFYLYSADAETVEAVIAEVTNTPWGDRHAYVLPSSGAGGPITGTLEKRMHVSPFMPLDQSYEWRAGIPGEDVRIRIANRDRGEKVFEADLAMRRRPLERAGMNRVLLRHLPQVPATVARIYANALRLRRKGLPVHPRPRPAAR